MDFSHYSDDSVEMAAALVNTRDAITGDDAISTVAALAEFLEPLTEAWGPGGAPRPNKTDLDEVHQLRSRLRGVFESPDTETAASRLNAILADVVATPRVSLHGAAPHLHFEPVEGRIAQWLGAAAAMGLSVVLVDEGVERFGVCRSASCNHAYVDTSRNRSRSYCSTTCTNRENVAAHRRRSRSTR